MLSDALSLPRAVLSIRIETMKLLFFTISFLNSLLSAAELYQFSVKGYPKAGQNCSQTATALSEQFVRETGATLTEVKSRPDFFSCDIDLFYSSEKPLPLQTAGIWSIYPSRKACEEHFQKEKIFFEETTGLSPFMGFCALDPDPNTSADGTYRFSPVFWALGSPKAFLKTFHFSLSEVKFSGTDHEIQEILKKSQGQGLPLVEVFFDELKYQAYFWMRFVFKSEPDQNDLSKYFELKSPLESPFSGNSDFDIDGDPMVSLTRAQCETQKELIQRSFSSHFQSPVVWFCMEDTLMYRFRLYHLVIKPNWASSLGKIIPGNDGEPFANEYESHQACTQDLPRLIHYYKGHLGDNVLGGLCSWPLSSQPKSSAFIYFRE